MLGTTGIGIRLIKSVTDNPTHQEKKAIINLREFLKDKLYEFNKFKEGKIKQHKKKRITLLTNIRLINLKSSLIKIWEKCQI